MRAGKLRHRVSIQAATEAISNSGSVSLAWTTVAKRWAFINPIAGGESIQGEQRIADTTHEVTIRHYADLTTKHRLLYGSRQLEIVSIVTVNEIEKEMRLACRETFAE